VSGREGAGKGRARLAEVLLHELGAVDADEGGGGVVRHRLGEHGLARAGWAVEENATRWVDPNLPVKLVVRQRQLHRLPDLLLLDVRAANVLRGRREAVGRAPGGLGQGA